MSSQHTYILSLCQRLHEQNKPLSTAMIKNLSDRPLKLPEVVKALNYFKSAPNDIKIDEKDIPRVKENKPIEDRVAYLENKVKNLQDQLDTLLKHK